MCDLSEVCGRDAVLWGRKADRVEDVVEVGAELEVGLSFESEGLAQVRVIILVSRRAFRTDRGGAEAGCAFLAIGADTIVDVNTASGDGRTGAEPVVYGAILHD